MHSFLLCTHARWGRTHGPSKTKTKTQPKTQEKEGTGKETAGKDEAKGKKSK